MIQMEVAEKEAEKANEDWLLFFGGIKAMTFFPLPGFEVTEAYTRGSILFEKNKRLPRPE